MRVGEYGEEAGQGEEKPLTAEDRAGLKELRRLKTQREILKSAAWFAKESLRGSPSSRFWRKTSTAGRTLSKS